MPETKKKTAIGAWHLLAGLIMAILGVYIWFNPAVTLMALALYLGVIFIIVGAGYLVASMSFQSGWYLLVGILDILVGVIFVANLGLTAVSIPIIFAIWCLAVGVIQIVASFEFRKLGWSWSWALAAGILGVFFGFAILVYPAIGALTITVLMGAYVFLYGLVEMAEYFTNKRIAGF